MSGKGSSRRGSDPESRRKFEEGWARIFKRGKDWRKVKERMRVELKSYPSWVCHACAMAAGGRDDGRDSTWHMGYCGVCRLSKPVTEPRDYGYPVFPVDPNR
jgi:hypothetical protein